MVDDLNMCCHLTFLSSVPVNLRCTCVRVTAGDIVDSSKKFAACLKKNIYISVLRRYLFNAQTLDLDSFNLERMKEKKNSYHKKGNYTE
jgi:hypothetical protein